LQEKDLGAKRPGTGIPAMQLNAVLGRVLQRALKADDQVAWSDLQT
jgi:sialic acid synthase SpsE